MFLESSTFPLDPESAEQLLHCIEPRAQVHLLLLLTRELQLPIAPLESLTPLL